MIVNLNNDIDPQLKKELNRISRLISIGFSTSESLASHVVVYKSLGIDKELAQICMLELARRRSLGEDFDYESFIEDKLKTIPQMSGMNLKNVASIMSGFGKSILGEK